MNKIAALYVATDGCYFGLDGIDPWDQQRDARNYAGPHPVIAHPPCQRWGRFWHGAPNKPHQYRLGEDDGCFESALNSVRLWGGILEHPKDSHAWGQFAINRPPNSGNWIWADEHGGWTCCVEQGHYGHFSRKPTWLYAHKGRAIKVDLPDLRWGKSEQRLPAYAVERYGYEKARRIGIMAAVGGKGKTRIRNATPPEFRDILISIARTISQ